MWAKIWHFNQFHFRFWMPKKQLDMIKIILNSDSYDVHQTPGIEIALYP
jgi:hypothetical protein